MDPKEIFDPFGIKSKVAEKQAKPSQEEKQEEPGKQQQEEPGKQQQQEEIDYKAKYEALQKFDFQGSDELASLLDEVEGETPAEKAKRIRDAAKRAKEIEANEQKREEWFRTNQIVHSKEFVERYAKPAEKALDIYNGLLCELDKEGEERNTPMFVQLRKAVFNGGKDITAAQIRSIMDQFRTQYASKFGAEPKLPTIKELMDARDDLIKAESRKIEAVQNWEAERERDMIRSKSEQQELQAKRKQLLIKERRDEFTAFSKEFDFKQYGDLFEESVVKENLQAIHDEVEGILSGNRAEMKYQEYLPNMLKAKMFDKLLQEAQELKKFKEEVEAGRRAARGGSSKEPIAQGQDKKDKTEKKVKDFFNLGA